MTELFELAVRYEVPLYQRPYVWEKDDQWEPLWEDIRALLEHQEGGAATIGGWSHFLGAIVLDQETQAPGTIPVYVVIDGQQRWTTLQVLLAAAAKVASNVNADKDAALMRELITNNPLKASGDEVFKVWPTNVNRKAFKVVMQDGGPPSDNSDDPNNKIEEAYDYFLSVLQEWVADSGSLDGLGGQAGLNPSSCAHGRGWGCSVSSQGDCCERDQHHGRGEREGDRR